MSSSQDIVADRKDGVLQFLAYPTHQQQKEGPLATFVVGSVEPLAICSCQAGMIQDEHFSSAAQQPMEHSNTALQLSYHSSRKQPSWWGNHTLTEFPSCNTTPLTELPVFSTGGCPLSLVMAHNKTTVVRSSIVQAVHDSAFVLTCLLVFSAAAVYMQAHHH
jgi:hypothetical protein